MAVITYKCDTCNRTIDKTQNVLGLEVMNHCVITASCKGSLFKVGTKGNSVARGFPSPVAGLTDWRARRLMYNHDQPVNSSVWKIDHDLNTNPSVQVYVNRTTGSPRTETLIEIEPQLIEYINPSTLLVHLNKSESGIAQCISRNATRVATKSIDVIQDIDPSSNDVTVGTMLTQSTLTIATLVMDTEINVGINFLSSKDLSIIEGINPLDFGAATSNSLWYPHELVFIKGKFYKIHSCLINFTQLIDSGVRDGSFFFFDSINGNPLKLGDAYILLSKPPNQTYVDREVDYVVDLTVANQSTAANNFIYYDLDFKVSESSKQLIFPAVQISQ